MKNGAEIIIGIILLILALIFTDIYKHLKSYIKKAFVFLITKLKSFSFCGKFKKEIKSLKQENEDLKLDKKKLSDEIEKLKDNVEFLESANKFSDNSLKWKKGFEEFKTLTFFSQFENAIKWVRNNYIIYDDLKKHEDLISFCESDGIIFFPTNFDPYKSFGEEIKFTEKGLFFVSEFLKEKHKIIPEPKKPNIIKVIDYSGFVA